MKYLKQEGIKSIISLTRSSLELELIKFANIENILHLPIYFSGIPQKNQIINMLDFIDKERDKENPVLVHCDEGYNRTGTIIAIYLIVNENFSLEEALKHIRFIRSGAISEHQENFLKDFAKNNNFSRNIESNHFLREFSDK